MQAVKAFNSSWTRTSIKTLKNNGALIIFPAGHVAAINDSEDHHPSNVFDSEGSWQDGFLKLARLGKADIVFANVDRPMSLDEIYTVFAEKYGHSRETLEADTNLTAELMRRFTYEAQEVKSHDLDTKDRPSVTQNKAP